MVDLWVSTAVADACFEVFVSFEKKSWNAMAPATKNRVAITRGSLERLAVTDSWVMVPMVMANRLDVRAASGGRALRFEPALGEFEGSMGVAPALAPSALPNALVGINAVGFATSWVSLCAV